MIVYVDNRNQDFARQCSASDGTHTQVGPGAKRAPIDERYTWKMHPDVIVSRETSRSFLSAEDQEAHNQLQAEEQKKAKQQEAEERDRLKKAQASATDSH